ncbi:MAG: HNH endonuclease [Kofleriaceae bacterium]
MSAWSLTRDALHARFLRRKRQQSAWDAEEARDLRIAESQQLWTYFGCVTLLEYLEVYCGIEPRTGLERIRVSFALADLPLLEAELEASTFQFSHVKELSRILVPDTEEEWIDHTRGMTYREVQRAVAGHVRGDRPTDPTQPDERRRFVGFHIKPSTAARLFALLRELEAERGDRFVDDDDKVNALCDRAGAVKGDAVARDGGATSWCARPPTQVWITTDGHAFANGVELDGAELATLTCDATIMGNVEEPDARPRHAIAPRKRRRILARDAHQCCVPGCRARHHLDVHHLVHREHGGDDSDANLLTLCGGHHRLHHGGLLDITGRAPNEVTFRRVNGDEEPSCPRGRERWCEDETDARRRPRQHPRGARGA